MDTGTHTCWGLTDGSAGMVAQVKALALAIGAVPEMKNVAIKIPFLGLPTSMHALFKSAILPHMLTRASDPLTSPYPDLVISCGRRAVIAALGLKAKAPQSKFICLQDPKTSAKYFDLVVVVDHDSIKGPNVIKTRFALHTITPEVLKNAAAHFAPQFAAYPKPHTVVLLGGSTHRYRFEPEAMAKVVMALQRVLKLNAGSLLITPSRRTGDINTGMLRALGHERVYIYGGAGENPYLGMLALADAIIVTNDSVNMMSEATATGKPIYILPLPGHTGSKPARFAEQLITDGIARPLGDKIESWDYPVSNEMQLVAQEVRKRLNW